MKRRTFHNVIAGLVGLTMLSTAAGCASPPRSRTVSVLATWTGTEEDDFRQVLGAFEDRNGIHVEYTGTRALDETLRSDLRGGTPPDIAILPSTGDLAQYARSGDLLPLDGVIPQQDRQEQYRAPWLLRLNQKIYAIPFKVNLKSIVWYNRSRLNVPIPRDEEDLLTLKDTITDTGFPDLGSTVAGRKQTLWCLGMQAMR
ncbi:ABC transporter substrate-binding protein, partial [Streptomyces anulatus]|uniref:ABC transporter substrate-binding protein n=1 Tax=Streptomyces anulatus TaxID=1892 RepID=UPI00343B99C1